MWSLKFGTDFTSILYFKFLAIQTVKMCRCVASFQGRLKEELDYYARQIQDVKLSKWNYEDEVKIGLKLHGLCWLVHV